MKKDKLIKSYQAIKLHGLEVKPCPFCGRIPRLYQTETFPHYSIYCECHQAQTDEYHTKEEAVEMWNTRAE